MEKQIKNRLRVTEHGEVFTADREVKAMCDLVWSGKESFESRFLEPSCGDGNFLAEILLRKLKLTEAKTDKTESEKKRDMLCAAASLYGIEILKDNCELCRERLYKIWENSFKSVFDKETDSKIYKTVKEIFKKNIVCGNTLTYKFVDNFGNDTERDIFFPKWEFNIDLNEYTFTENAIFDIKFDVIISNPPYHLNDGGNGASAKPIYQHFIERSENLNPDVLCMIIPARWYAGGKGLDGFRKNMLNDRRICELHDYVNAKDCFVGVEIKGGVCYFLWKKDYNGPCKVVSYKDGRAVSEMKRELLEKGNTTFIRCNEAVEIVNKVSKYNEKTFDSIVSPRKPFAFASDFRDYSSIKTSRYTVNIYARKEKGYVAEEQITKNKELVNKWKVFVPEAIGSGKISSDVVKPILGEPNTVCTETYVVIGPTESEEQARNICKYISTKFFHFLLGIKKISQHTTAKTYSFIPLQDFSQEWTDEKLYSKYGFSQKEIDFIEKSVWSDLAARQI